MGRHGTIIRTSDGDSHGCVEWPSQVVAIRDKALADGCLMELELPDIPTGKKFWLDPGEVISIKPDPHR